MRPQSSGSKNRKYFSILNIKAAHSSETSGNMTPSPIPKVNNLYIHRRVTAKAHTLFYLPVYLFVGHAVA
jgi:hypothetical protein